MATKAKNLAIAAANKVDGSGNVAADTLDGIDSPQFLRSDADDTMTGDLDVQGTVTADGLTVYDNDSPVDFNGYKSQGIGVVNNASGEIRLGNVDDYYGLITYNGIEGDLYLTNTWQSVDALSHIVLNDKNRATFRGNGDISFYDSAGTTPKFFWDASAERLGIGTDDPQLSLDLSNKTDAIALPAGTTAQRPSSPAQGYIRHNTSLDLVESFNGTSWVAVGDQVGQYNVEYLVIAGGGGGGASSSATSWASGGGGGAGGYLAGNTTVAVGSSINVVVGAGGAGGSRGVNFAPNGSNSQFDAVTAIGGGGGSAWGSPNNAGRSGGSGGGSANDVAGGSGTMGQGNSGGRGSNSNTNQYGAGGGGGAGSAGNNVVSNGGGDGGNGLTSSITGNPVTRAGGGGGGSLNGDDSSGGTGGGGVGRGSGNTAGGAAVANTGSGGGGAASGNSTGAQGGNGGSGIVIIRYLGSQRGAGGTVTSSGGYTIHTFTSSGTFTP